MPTISGHPPQGKSDASAASRAPRSTPVWPPEIVLSKVSVGNVHLGGAYVLIDRAAIMGHWRDTERKKTGTNQNTRK